MITLKLSKLIEIDHMKEVVRLQPFFLPIYTQFSREEETVNVQA